MARTIITDACFWIGLLDDHDEHASKAVAWQQIIMSKDMVIPWPCVYEVISTRMARRADRISQFTKHARQQRVTLLDDNPYRDAAWEECVASRRNLSLADCVIRRIICDRKIRKHDLITFNPDDFRDVCRENRVDLLYDFPPKARDSRMPQTRCAPHDTI